MESFSNYITELFDSKNIYSYTVEEDMQDDGKGMRYRDIDWNEERPGQKRLIYNFKSDNGTYFRAIYRSDEEIKNWDLVFANRRKDNKTYVLKSMEIMGGFETKEVIKIFNTIIETMLDVIYGEVGKDKHDYYFMEREGKLKFQADADEPSRVRLYKRLINKFQDRIKKHFKISIDESKGEYVDFEIIAKSSDEKYEDRKKESDEKKNRYKELKRKKKEEAEKKKSENENKEKEKES